MDAFFEDQQVVLILTKSVIPDRFLNSQMLLLCLLAVVLMVQFGVLVPIILRRTLEHERTVSQARESFEGNEGLPIH